LVKQKRILLYFDYTFITYLISIVPKPRWLNKINFTQKWKFVVTGSSGGDNGVGNCGKGVAI
jgi:hypothetical protein